jgi:uncharacterized protein
MTAIYAIVALLMVAGLVGSVIPFLPATPLVFLGALVYALATDWDPIGPGRLTILGAIAAAGWLLQQLASAMGARHYGGSRAAVIGALLGTVVGLFTAPVGLLLGPIVGAIAGELLATGRPRESVQSGLGALVGLAAGAITSLVSGLVMIALFLWWAARG